MSRWHMAGSAGSWPNTTLNVLACRLERSAVSFVLWRMTWDWGLLGVYGVPCGCGQVYIRQTGQSIETRIIEHSWHIWLGHPDKSVLAELEFNHKHVIKFQDPWIFCAVPSCMEHLIRWAVDLELNPNAMSTEDGLTLSGSWKPLLSFRESRWLTYSPFPPLSSFLTLKQRFLSPQLCCMVGLRAGYSSSLGWENLPPPPLNFHFFLFHFQFCFHFVSPLPFPLLLFLNFFFSPVFFVSFPALPVLLWHFPVSSSVP